MAYSYYTYTGTGSQTQFPVAFGYIRREHVLATVAGSPATFTWVNSTTIQMDVAPANGATVRVYRVTPLSAPLVDFADGATLVAADLDTNAKQSIYTQQELDDSLVDGLAGVIPNGDKGDITTSVGGTVWTIDSGAVVEAKIGTGAVVEAKIGTGAVTSAKIADGTIVNADINASAAIAGTKLAFAPAGSVAATTVQAAIEELDTEKAPLASPTFTGTPAAPTATAGTNTTQLATTAFVLGQSSSTTPVMNGTAAVGTGTTFARADHVHASDTSRAPLASPSLTGNLSFNSGYGSSAVAYGCRAWVNFNGSGTVAIRGSGNVSSITDNGTGDYTVNFTTAMPDANYAFSTGWMGTTGESRTFVPADGEVPTASSIRLSYQQGGSTPTDKAYLSVAIFR